MSFSATNAHREKKFWIREHRNSRNPEDRTLKRSQGLSEKPIQGGSRQYQEQVARERGSGDHNATNRRPSQPAAIGPVSGTPGPPSTARLHSTSLTSVSPSYIQERHYSRPLLGNVAYSQYPVSAVSSTRSPAIANAAPKTSSRTLSVPHSSHSTAVSVVSDAKSHASTVSATQHSAPGTYHPHPPQTVSTPSQGINNSYASSAVRITPSTPPEHPLLLPAPRARSRAQSEVSVAPSTAPAKYPALPVSTDSSRASSVISAVQSWVPESHPPLPDPRAQNYRAPSVISVASSAASVQHPPLSVSRVPSEVQNAQPSRSQSVVSAARSAVREDHLLLPASESRSPSVASSDVSLIKESSGYLQESHSRDPSRALALRAPSSQPPASRAASVTPSIRSEHAVSIPSDARRRADEVHARSEVGKSSSVAESSARGCRPSVVYRDDEYADQVPERAQSMGASTRGSIKSSRNERDVSIASTARSRAREEVYEPRTQSKSTSKRASSIKPSSRSERGDSTASKVRGHIQVDDYESSIERAPTSKRALSKASSTKSSRKASRDDRGRSTTSRTGSAQHEPAEVTVTYDEHEDAGSKSLSYSERSKSASTRRSSSVSSVETVRPLAGKHNALVVYHDNAVHTAEASKDNVRRRSVRRKKKPDIDVRSYVGSDNVTVVLPDPSEVSRAEPASASKDQQKQRKYRDEYQEWQRQERQSQQQYQQRGQYQQPYSQTYPQPDPHTYPAQYQQQPQAPYPAYGYPNVHPQYPIPQYTYPPYPGPQYAHPQPTAQPNHPTASARYPSQPVTPTPQCGTGYERLGEELEQGRKSGRLPKARDKRREKVERPRRTTRREGKYEQPPEIYESQYDDGEFPDRWFDN